MRLFFPLFAGLLFGATAASAQLKISPLTGNFYIYTTYNTYKERIPQVYPRLA